MTLKSVSSLMLASFRVDGHDADAIRQATVEAKAETQNQRLLFVKQLLA